MAGQTEDRRELADAQKRLAEAEQELAACQGINPWAMIADARAALAKVQAELAEAGLREVNDLVARQMGQPVPDRPSRAALQAAVTAAEAGVESARQTRAAIERRAADAEQRVKWAKGDVASIIRRLLEDSPEVAALVEAIRDAERHLIELHHALNAIGGATEAVARNEARMVAKTLGWGGPPPDWHMLPDVASDLVTAWRGAVQALQTNAYALLPGGTAPEPRGRKPKLFAA
jgi:hypothetical protein